MVRLTGSISQLSNQKVLVIGDFLLDTYTVGKARRISPEAPVAVIQVEREEHRPGGAGNVALNLLSLGSNVMAVGRMGEDLAGELLIQTLQSEGISTEGLFVQAGYSTPVKNRVVAENQQIVRIDRESLLPIPEMLEQQIIEKLSSFLKDVKVVAVSDYGKGFLSPTLLSVLMTEAKTRGIPVITDPKGIDFAKYQGSTILKPNLKEAYEAVNLPFGSSLDEVAKRVLKLTQAEVLMITRSECGISLFYPTGKREDFPVAVREVKDVTGAGDTVLAILACSVASGLPLDEAAQLSNVAAGIAIERFGCARVTLCDLAHRLLELDVDNKVFNEYHFFALQEVLRGKSLAIIGLSSKDGFSPALFEAIQGLRHRENWKVLVNVLDERPSPAFIQMLASLHTIDFITLYQEGMNKLCSSIQPHEIYLASKEGLQKIELEAILF
ncbi:bifunctional ADP-heptose synthase [Parachlamydia sp. AcF125]|uniref:bifunctional heptose 7-phosphate kinase/heptose 1-phosphate adenyltransferase n=1 Tax=Parachlamydia sp. AcF125 TaxID=2795736 RepID=UPI001BCA07CE|nr:bifunctional ADP-heptose synthase [Parachlamydia sp. AcF125]MBS4168481.1 Bifunctional protein HldE [Parachlamydia sp. AcF125]